MREIELTQGKVALVSDEDFEFLSQWKWCVYTDGRGHWYALRGDYSLGRNKRKGIRMHRVILERMLRHSNFQLVDHIDGNGINNQRDNLRPITHKQNAENRRGANRDNRTSGILGVCWDKKTQKWHAQIKHNDKNIHLGFHEDIIDAELEVLAARDQYFTHHAN